MIQRWPTSREEKWKYTSLGALSQKTFAPSAPVALDFYPHDWGISFVFVNGFFNADLSDLHLLPKEVVALSLSQALKTHADLICLYGSREFDINQYPFAASNTASLSDGLFLYVPKQCVIESPIHLTFYSTEQNDFMSCPRNIIVADTESEITLIEDYRANFDVTGYFTNAVTELTTKHCAKIHYVKIQDEHRTATHFSHVFVNQSAGSHVDTFFVDKGASLSRSELVVHLSEPDAVCDMKGLVFLEHAGQQVDHQVVADHAAPGCSSRMVYKGVLKTQSTSVFNGKVLVRPIASETVSHQESHYLMLSPHAEVNTQPQLEIYADNVKCTHGATIGSLAQEAYFYLRSRGMDAADASAMLMHAFVSDVLSAVSDPAMREYLLMRIDHVEH